MKRVALVLLVALTSVPIAAARTRPARKPAAAAAPADAASAATQTLPIRRVTIYSNGVAYVERRGTISGHAEIALPFKESQVDDALKSMIVLDLGKGRIGAVSYASSEPPEARLANIPLSIDAETSGDDELGGVGGVLKQLQGARVAVTAGARTATGAILTVDKQTERPDPQKPGVTTRTLVIATDEGGIESFDLATVKSVRLVDDNARRNVAEFADASAAARRQDSNTIVVTSDGAGSREMVVGYTVAAPIWKTTYRVVLDDSGKPFFQGWAIVDNVSEENWQDVALSLVSGTPLSFVQHLQQPFYRHRPEVPIPDDVELTPQDFQSVTLGGGAGRIGAGQGGAPSDGPGSGTTITATQIQNLSSVSRGYAGVLNNSMSVNAQAAIVAVHPTLAAPALSETSGVSAAASGNEVGDLFEYRVENPVTVNRNRSALIPILQTRLEGVRVSLYDAGVRADRPLGGVRLKNTSSLVLETGPMAIFDGSSYVGDAMMDRMKPGEERFIPFSVDLGTLVSVADDEKSGPVYLVRALDGAIDAQYFQVRRKTYTIRNQTDATHIVYVRHPKDDDWTLTTDTPAPASTAPDGYRFRVELAPRAVQTLTVAERSESHDRFALSDISREEVAMLLSRRYIDDATRAVLDHIVEIKTRLAVIDASLESYDDQVEAIGDDQKRLRENVESLRETPEAKALIARYVAKVDAQETTLEKLASDKKEAEAERTRLNAELAAAVRDFKLERKVE